MTAAAAPPNPAGPPPARLFLGLWPDAATRQALVAWQAGWSWPAPARPTPAERLHLTLHFIGTVPRTRLPALQAALPPAGPAFDIAFGHAELWPAGLAVAVPTALPPALLALHARLGQVLLAQGLPVEARAFRPHVTLARQAAGARPPAPALALRWCAADYVLVESERGYRRLASY